MADYISGFSLGLSLILAIGAQNAFVLRAGLRRDNLFIICLICTLSDALLITIGVFGFDILLESLPSLDLAVRLGGTTFLFFYGAWHFRSAWTGGAVLLAAGRSTSRLASVLTCLALTWLNPHVYLDTVILLGAIAAQHSDRLAFALGAITASSLFFHALGYGAHLLTPLFARPRSWQVFDVAIGVLMWVIALRLIL